MLGPFPLPFVIIFYYLLRSAATVVILQLTFNINVKTMFLLFYDKMAGGSKSSSLLNLKLIYSGFSEELVLTIMWVFVILFTSISLVIEATIKSSTRDPALGKLKIFLFMGGENITERDISEKRLSIYFIGATLVLLLVSLFGLNLAKYYQRR